MDTRTNTPRPETIHRNISTTQDPNRLLRLKEVLHLVPVSKSCWWGWVATGKAPAPVRLGSRCTCWRYVDVIALVNGEVQP
jgi:prophage regulatory protein